MSQDDQAKGLRATLERFVYDNPELERLEAMLNVFNPFVALRWTHQESRHSAFLRWLLDPAETHGLGPYFLGAFWKRVAQRSTSSTLQAPTVIDVDSWDLSDVTVLQEWHEIDLLVEDDKNHFIGVIENKVDSSEHGEQLQRYRVYVERQFPRYKKLFVYLTADGEIPSDETYVPLGYDEILPLVKETLERRAEVLSPEVRSFLRHYMEMVGRYIVEDSEIQELCRKIYEKHRNALDVLFENRPDKASEIRDILLDVIKKNDQLIPDHATKTYIRFISKKLDFFARVGEGWTQTNRILLFEFVNSNGLSLKLELGPGEKELRKQIYRLASKHHEVFNQDFHKLYTKWQALHIEKWLTMKQSDELDTASIRTEVEQRLSRFLEERLPKMEEILLQLRR